MTAADWIAEQRDLRFHLIATHLAAAQVAINAAWNLMPLDTPRLLRERCKQIDLGAWASESYRVAGQVSDDEAGAPGLEFPDTPTR